MILLRTVQRLSPRIAAALVVLMYPSRVYNAIFAASIQHIVTYPGDFKFSGPKKAPCNRVAWGLQEMCDGNFIDRFGDGVLEL